ncbi:peptidoglycan endopeptidase [Neobacillus notoginsengisoli]|uniref:Peptidoglycan endopeptidase n=1 Tax=Neobacillus notoginsengisoli TaxID=1578198 RepID=A0A417YS04_9BACI|nr:C40 family peptidase [Neobacillus notoginsengisoli]RHW38070.1 peptidoglycan endopeptidase [Neobacillus notoginsengisoli]
MKKHFITSAMAAGILFGTFNGQASAAELYTVKSGDTLWGISKNYSLTVSQIKQWNNLSGDLIYVNQKLSMEAPEAKEAPKAAPAATYTVKSGDTLWGISKTYNTTVNSLKSLNALTSDLIRVGQVLKVSGTSSTAVASASTAPAPKVTTAKVAPATSKATIIINEAKKHLGAPYVWGGNTPAGFDCSGYIKYVFGKAGISLPRTAATIWTATKPVSTIKLGDLVFFETYTTGPSHVGIYLGNNKFINAASNGVVISDMSNSYWKQRYLGARTAL